MDQGVDGKTKFGGSVAMLMQKEGGSKSIKITGYQGYSGHSPIDFMSL